MYPEERQYVLEHLDELVVKAAQRVRWLRDADRAARDEEGAQGIHQPDQEEPRNYIVQPTLGISTVPTAVGQWPGAAPRRLRPFILSGRRNHRRADRVALRKGSLVVNSSQGRRFRKDTWIVETD